MKAQSKSAELAMSFVSKIASSSIVPSYGNVMINAVNGVASFTCTNGQTTLTAQSPCDGDLIACVDAKKLATFCNNATTDLKFAIKGEKLTITSGRSRASLAVTSSDGFPPEPVVDGDSKQIDGDALKSCLDRVIYAVGKNDSRPAANGVYMDDGHVVCTQGTLLSASPLDLGMNAILPSNCIASLGSMLGGVCVVSSDKNAAQFQCGDFRLTTKLVSAQYFPWQKVIPKTDKQFSFNRADFLKSLSRVQMTANAVIMRCVLEIEGDVLTVSTSDASNDTSDEIDLISNSGDLRIMFNINFLTQTCNALSGDVVTVGYTVSDRPTIFSDGSDNQHVITPQK